MSLYNLIAFTTAGDAFALADNRELLVHDFATQSPLWRQELPARIVGLGAEGSAIVAVDDAGQMTLWDAKSGQARGQLTLGSTANGLAMSPTGTAAVLLPDSVAIVSRNKSISSVRISDACAAAWSGDGGLLAIGTTYGDVTIVGANLTASACAADSASGVKLPFPVQFLCWHDGGDWLASAGSSIWTIDRLAASHQELITELPEPPDFVACSRDGGLLAFTTRGKSAKVLNANDYSVVASVTYTDRSIQGLLIGPSPFLAISLDGGDANLFNLADEQVLRSDPHPGRDHTRWTLKVGLHSDKLPPTCIGSLGKSKSQPTPGDSATVPRNQSFPGWMGPIVGAGIGGFFGTKVNTEIPIEQRIPAILLGAALGCAGGLLIWLWDWSRSRDKM